VYVRRSKERQIVWNRLTTLKVKISIKYWLDCELNCILTASVYVWGISYASAVRFEVTYFHFATLRTVACWQCA